MGKPAAVPWPRPRPRSPSTIASAARKSCSYFRPNGHRGAAPHHCDFIDALMGDQDLRLDCGEHAEAPPALRETLWLRWSHTT
jgi:hypothetical protein